MTSTLARQAAAEALGTAFLVAAVVGSGIAAQRLSPDDAGLQLLENSLTTGAVLVALILAFQPLSAAFKPVVTLVERVLGRITTAAAAILVAAQVLGGLLGVVAANLMFDLDPVSISAQHREGDQADGRGEPYAALRNIVTSTLIMGSPARRLTNPITRCWEPSPSPICRDRRRTRHPPKRLTQNDLR